PHRCERHHQGERAAGASQSELDDGVAVFEAGRGNRQAGCRRSHHRRHLRETDDRPRVSRAARHDRRWRGRHRPQSRPPADVVQSAPAPLRNVPTTQTLAGVDGIQRFFGNSIVDRGPWLLSVGIPTSVAASRLAPLWWRNLTISLAALVAMLIVSLWFAHLLS